jgi:hypothetical protein
MPSKHRWLLAAVLITGLLSALAITFASPVFLLMPLLLTSPLVSIPLIAAMLLTIVLLLEKKSRQKK